MQVFDPGSSGPWILSGGTFSANPVTMAAGLAAMRAMTEAEFARLEVLGTRLRARMSESLRAKGVAGQVTGEASLFRILLSNRSLRGYRDVDPDADTRADRLCHALLDAGVVVHTNGLGCLSTPMSDQEVEEIVASLDRALSTMGPDA